MFNARVIRGLLRMEIITCNNGAFFQPVKIIELLISVLVESVHQLVSTSAAVMCWRLAVNLMKVLAEAHAYQQSQINTHHHQLVWN